MAFKLKTHYDFEARQAARQKMVAEQIVARGVTDDRVLAAMREVPREAFVGDDYQDLAYEDMPLPIGFGQTISQPYIVGFMAALANLAANDVVLEIGTGSGYGAAVLSRVARHVYSIERDERLLGRARKILDELGYQNISMTSGDGSKGWAEHAPYDAIIVTAGAPDVPAPYQTQLNAGGRLLLPIGQSERSQHLYRFTKAAAAADTQPEMTAEDFGPVAFVPLKGAHGWHKD